jgi:hypothetical protein
VLKLRPPGYFSWTIWPDSKSTPGRRPPRGILLFLSQLSFLIFAKCREYHVVRKQCFFFSSRNQHLWIFWIQIRFSRSPGLPGFPEIFFLVCQSRPPKAPSCDLPTRDRISSKGPGEIWPMVSATYPVSDKIPSWLQAEYLRHFPLAVGGFSRIVQSPGLHLGDYFIWHSFLAESRVDF